MKNFIAVVKMFLFLVVWLLIASVPAEPFDSYPPPAPPLYPVAPLPSWNADPNNYRNSPSNYENSPYNYRNSPNNYDNSPIKYGNDRIIRDESGTARGYIVPKPAGGANIFDIHGNRRAYIPGE